MKHTQKQAKQIVALCAEIEEVLKRYDASFTGELEVNHPLSKAKLKKYIWRNENEGDVCQYKVSVCEHLTSAIDAEDSKNFSLMKIMGVGSYTINRKDPYSISQK